MVTQAPRRSALVAALAFALSCIGLVVFVWTQFGGTIPFSPEGYRVSAAFREAGQLVPGADVRISGVNVGRVAEISSRGVDSIVTVEVYPQYAPLPASTRAILRQKTLLGEGYVQLSAGPRTGRMLRDGATIPVAQVQATQSLDQVLGAFDKPTQRNFEALLNGTAAALAGRGQDLNNALGNLNPATTELTAVVGVLNEQQGNVRRLISTGATVLGTLGSRSAQLRTLITAGDQVLASTAARNAALSATVDALPPFLGRLRSTLRVLDGTLGLAKPSLDALQPVAPLLTPALHSLIRLSGPAVTLLHEAPSLVAAADRALPAIERFSRAFKPAIDALLPATRELTPMISFIALYRAELTTAMADLAASLEATSSANTPSGRASYLRAISMISNESPYGQTVREPTNRNNAYFAPGELVNAGRGGLQSAGCAHAANPAQVPVSGRNVACRRQPGVDWGSIAASGYFPRLTRAPLPR
jgi:phospholipid/cholesterol/gamma-HCH transport system substrate-binding protein